MRARRAGHRHGSLRRGGRAPASLFLVPLLLAACRPEPIDPIGLALPPEPFERAPYLQAVDTTAARLVWRVRRSADEALRFRLEGGEWLAGEVERLPGGDRRAALEGLTPGRRVEYEVTAAGATVGPIGFRTAPRAGAAGEVRVLAFGDSGYGSAAQLLLARLMAEREWDLILHAGDVAYDSGTDAELTRRHFAVYRPTLAQAPFFPVPGNHDLEANGGRSYDSAFVFPAPFPGVRYYAFRWGPVQFVALDTSSDMEDVRGLRRGRGRQYEWLTKTLAAARADPTVEWTVVYAHHPPYSHAAGFSGHGGDRLLRAALAPLFEENGVDLVIAGHDHHYERTRPVREGRPAPDGCAPVYIVTGGGGASLFARDVGPSVLAARISRRHHFVSLRFTGAAIEGESVGTDGSPLDEFALAPYEPGAAECEDRPLDSPAVAG